MHHEVDEEEHGAARAQPGGAVPAARPPPLPPLPVSAHGGRRLSAEDALSPARWGGDGAGRRETRAGADGRSRAQTQAEEDSLTEELIGWYAKRVGSQLAGTTPAGLRRGGTAAGPRGTISG